MKNTVNLILLVLFLIISANSKSSLIEYEYWINEDIQNKTVVPISNVDELDLNTELELNLSKKGFYLFNIRFKDNENNYSPLYSRFFFYGGKSNQTENEIVQIEYWIDNKFDDREKLDVTSEELIADDIDLKSFERGLHILKMRFKDVTGLWSSVISRVVFISGPSDSDENLITEYRYWTDDNFTSATTVKLDKPVALYELNSVIELPIESAETFNIQFLDIAGLWSVVHTRAFTPEADFEIFNTVNTFTFKNTTTFGQTYSWDFGNGAKSNVVHPTVTYDQPGVYDVCLIAENNLGKDTICKTIEVKGLREVVSNEGGNSGYATVKVYGGGLENESKVWLEKNGVKYLDAEFVQLARLDALEARFNLYDKELGTYDVVVELPDGTVYKLEEAYSIVQGTQPEPFLSLDGRDRTLFGRWQTYKLSFGNKGNTDALGVPVYLLVTMTDDFEIEFKNLELNISQHWSDRDDLDELLSQPDFIEHQGYFGGDELVRLYSFYIPNIPANYNGQLEFRIKSNQDFKMLSWMHEPMFEVEAGTVVMKEHVLLNSALDKKVAACLRAVMFQAAKDGIAEVVNNVIPGVGCANSILNEAFKPADYIAPDPTNPEFTRPKSWSETFWSWGATVKDLTLVVASCATDFIPVTKAYKVAVGVLSAMNNIYNGLQAGNDCYKKYSTGKKDVRAVSSFDPNEIVGPGGFGEKNYVNSKGFGYTIFFENLETATAPAQEVFIHDTLDVNKFDFESFSFGQFSFGDETYSPLPGIKEFTLDIESEETGNIVRVNASFDVNTGVAYWEFVTLDPMTMDLTEDPLGGFLPPNKTSPEGEGSVSYLINLKDELTNDELIEAKAKIVFDLNEPIFTNTYSNSLDYVAPQSNLTGIYYTDTEGVYRIHLDGSDSESGIRNYIIYHSTDGIEYEAIFETKEAVFYLELDLENTHYLYSQAADNVGNYEVMKDEYEVSTLNVSVNSRISLDFDYQISPNPAFDNLHIRTNQLLELNSSETNILVIYDVYGNEVLSADCNGLKDGNFELDISQLNSGVYLIRLANNIKKFIKF